MAPQPVFSLAGRVALVTGARRGLGREIAAALAGCGAHVVLNGRDPDALDAAAAELADDGGDVSTAPFDVCDRDAAREALAGIEAARGRLDILVNNVGYRDRRTLFEFAPGDLDAMFAHNLVAPFELARLAAPPMMERQHGRILNLTSVVAQIAGPGDAAYTAAKGGLEALTRALSAELGPHGITVNGISPGFFATDSNARKIADPDIARWLTHRTALGRWAEPREIAAAAVFLASDEASYVSGQVLAVDGHMLGHL